MAAWYHPAAMIRVLAPVSLALAVVTAAVLWAQESPPPLLPPQAPSGPTPMPAVLRNYTSVTESRLRSPNDGDWTMNRRTYDGWGYSPLTQITAANVARLKPVWSFSTGAINGHEAAPIVHDGVMFVATPGSQVIAIEAATGTVLWRYRRPLGPAVINRHPTTRGVGLLGDKVFLAASDAVLMALDARTGRTVWSTTVADNRGGHYMSLAPLVADGKVLVGTSGGELGIRGFIAAYDPDTGKELWRTYTVPAPGEPGSETWPRDGEQWKTGGGSVWVAGNYDPETNLAYWGTGNGGPWIGDQRPGDNLYTASTIAVDLASGQIKGHFQYTPNESFDWDEVSPPILVDFQRNGRTVKGLIDVARNGYLWFLERGTGPIRFVQGVPHVRQTVFRSLDPVTGRPDVDPAHKPGTGKVADFCPSHWGGKNWPPIAYSPQTRLVYVPANENLCASMEGLPVKVLARFGLHWREKRDVDRTGRRSHRGSAGVERGHRRARVDPHLRQVVELGTAARDRWWAGLWRRNLGPHVPGVRRTDWKGPVGVPHQLRRHRPGVVVHPQRTSVRCGAVRVGHRRARDAEPAQRHPPGRVSGGAGRWCGVGVRAGRLT